ncbi:MarR family winged helix-turn-helix transcriptional regulator [Geothrix sp. 21YS21S-4]|uniref:MarR family winged helix-turn-helix transcriptional regulator n=1 Tax=Geothrix sp. 21YS21S-4 TaxID=3068889 RepID=UPI0027B97929|nr:MarR family winged helix-turn-helix transcriptional regulator [Geothrix sp. 21YS21S-4]
MRRRLKQVVWARLTPYGLSPQQFWVLLVLLRGGPSSLHPLAQHVWMDDPTASRVVKAMVARGWLTTRPDPHHGRRILIEVAPETLPRARELEALALELKTGLAAGMDSAEQAAMSRGLHAMIRNLDGMLGADAAEEPSETEAP